MEYYHFKDLKRDNSLVFSNIPLLVKLLIFVWTISEFILDSGMGQSLKALGLQP